ncbi:SDR family oxidoreductase [Bordetella petrii]|nr:SDR family oxidoreductase [Bordetella petrii]
MAASTVFKEGILSDRVTLITGGSSGLGLGMASKFQRLGANLILVGRDIAKLERAQAELAPLGKEVLIYASDVRSYEGTQEIIGKVLDRYGRIDVLINNAAGNFHCPFEKLSPNGWRSVVDIDLNGTFNFCHASLAGLKQSRWGGRVINISLAQAVSGWPGSAHAASAKAGVTALTRSLAVEWGPYAIRVNNILPGPIANTEGVKRLYEDFGQAEKELNRLCLDSFGHTDDIAHAAAYLASEAGNFITGCDLSVDGGRWLKRAWV